MHKRQRPSTIPEPGHGKRGEHGHLGYLLRQSAAAHRLRMERALADLGVTPPQFIVLTMCAAYPGASSADLARLALLTPQTLSVIVANLERAGAIVRRKHLIHRRIQHLDLTASGSALLKRCRTRVKTAERGLAAGLSAAEERTIRRWLVTLAVGSVDRQA